MSPPGPGPDANTKTCLKMGEQLFSRKLVNLVFPEMRSIVRAHQARGHTVVLSSSATCYQVEPVARHLGIEHVLCNRFAVNERGELTGQIDPRSCGGRQGQVVQRFARDRNIDLNESYFYADGDEELGLMYLVGKAPANQSWQAPRTASPADVVGQSRSSTAARKTASYARWQGSPASCQPALSDSAWVC